MNRLINIASLLLTLAASWVRHVFGIRNRQRIKLGEEIGPQLGQFHSILIFGYMGMGDAVMFEPTLTAYLNRFPDASFDLIVGTSSQSLPILQRIAEQNGRSFRTIYTADFKSLGQSKLRELNAKLTAAHYDACLAVYTTPIQYFIRAVESIPIRIGHKIRAQAWYKPRPNYLFNITREVSQNIDEREPYRHFRLAQAVGIQTQGDLPIPRMTVPKEQLNWAANYIASNGLSGKELIAVHLGVSRAMQWKKWPDERYAEVFKTLQNPNRHFLFFGSSDEAEDMRRASKNVGQEATLFCGNLDIMQVAALIMQSRAVIGNDSGIGHLSVALGIPTFRIFGPSDHFGCEPYTPGHATFFKNLTCSPCMNLGLIKPGYSVLNCGHRNCLGFIRVEEVTRSISGLLQRESV